MLKKDTCTCDVHQGWVVKVLTTIMGVELGLNTNYQWSPVHGKKLTSISKN